MPQATLLRHEKRLIPTPLWGIPKWNGIRPAYQRDRNYRAPTILYCASVSPIVRCVSANVRQTATSVSDNLRRKGPSIARRAVHHCASLQVGPALDAGNAIEAVRARRAKQHGAMAVRVGDDIKPLEASAVAE